MNMTKVSLAGCLVAGITSVSALGGAFPDKNGSHDLTDPAAWDGVWPQTSNVRMDNGGTFNCNTQDATFTGIWPNAKNVVITNNPGRTITLNGTNIMYPYNAGVTMELRGGTWDFSDKSTQMGSLNGTKLTLSGGVILTNVNTLAVRDAAKTGDHALTITNAGTRIFAKGISNGYKQAVAYTESGDASQEGVVVDVSDGAYVKLTGTTMLQSHGGWVLVRGTSTLVEASGSYMRFGSSGTQGGGLHVTQGATMTYEGSNLIMENATQGCAAKVLVDNGATFIVAASLNLGSWGSGNNGNEVVVGGDGTLTLGSVWAKGAENWLVVSNGALTVTGHCQLQIENANRLTSGVRIAGYKPKFSAGKCTLQYLTLEWNLPDRPFETTGALIEAGSFTVSTLRYSINGLADFVKAIPETTEVVLMEATAADGAVPNETAEMTRVNALLDAEAPGSRIYRTTDGKKLILHAKKKKGLAIILR